MSAAPNTREMLTIARKIVETPTGGTIHPEDADRLARLTLETIASPEGAYSLVVDGVVVEMLGDDGPEIPCPCGGTILDEPATVDQCGCTLEPDPDARRDWDRDTEALDAAQDV